MKTIKKAKNGKSFPDLNKDGKITKADILKGRGVIAKKGATVKKAQYGGKAASMVPTKKAKSGKKVEKAFLGNLLGGGGGGGMLGGMLGGGGGGNLLGGMFGGEGLRGGLNKMMGSLGRKKTSSADPMVSKSMKKGGTINKAQSGSKVKKTKTSKQPMNTIIPGMGIPTSAPKKVETMNAKVGKSMKKCKGGC